MKTKITISAEMREFNDAVELADYLTDFRFDRMDSGSLLKGLESEVEDPSSSVSVNALKNAIAGIAVKR